LARSQTDILRRYIVNHSETCNRFNAGIGNPAEGDQQCICGLEEELASSDGMIRTQLYMERKFMGNSITELYTNVNPSGKDPVFYREAIIPGMVGEDIYLVPTPVGWYHFDETWVPRHAHGPFNTRKEAQDACLRYMESLG
jgi:hypothetical protein